MDGPSRSDVASKGVAKGGERVSQERQEDQVLRELRDGIAVDTRAHHHHGHDHDHGIDDGYGMGD
jgi:hypothetical protein